MKKVTMTTWLLAFALISNIALSHAAPPANAPKAPQQGTTTHQVRSSQTAPVNLNQASLEELESIKGVGPALAERIIAYRSENGKFKTAEDLMNVKGIGQAKFGRIKEQVMV